MPKDRARLDAIKTASVDELRNLQLERLKKTIHHAYNNSPVYKINLMI